LGFATGSDPLLSAALWIGAGALLFSVLLLCAILALRLRLVARLAHERRFAELWRPVFAACAMGMPEEVPPLDPEDGPLFLALWLRAQESMRGDVQQHLNALAAVAGADRLAVGYLASGDSRREMLALVAAGHMRLEAIWPLADALAAQAPPVVSLAAAQTMLRIDARRALPDVMVRAARREDWPIARLGAMLRECDVREAGLALAAAIDAERQEAPQGPGIARLLRLLGAVAAESARPAVLGALAQIDRPDVAAAALETLWNPEDAGLAQSRLAHDEWYVRLAAVKALGRIGGSAHRDALQGMLSDPNWWVRYRAAQALVRLPGVDRGALVALQASSSDRYAADMLGQVLSETEAG
jgi:hypothetical protein